MSGLSPQSILPVGDYVVVMHPTAADDLRKLCMRDVWQYAYRAYRAAYPRERLTPREILHKFSQGSFIAGELVRLWGIEL